MFDLVAPKTRKPASALYLLVGIAVLLLYLMGIGSYPLVDPDEPVYGQVAKEMATGSGWLTPHMDGKAWFDKPPLFYWLSGVSARAIGPESETASRLPSAVLGAGLVLLVMGLASSELGRRTGLFAAIVIGTCIQQIVLAHSAVTDMTFVFFLTAALFAYRRWFTAAPERRLFWALAVGVMTGLATLTKGPVAPVLLSMAFVIDLWLAKSMRRLLSWDAAAAVGSLCLVALPWYLAMYILHGDVFVQGFLVANNITRFLKPEHASQTGSWLSYFRNFGVLLLFFFPWSGFIPQAIKLGWRKNDCLRLCTVWSGVVFVFFSISKTQLPTYIFPLYPAAAILVGYLWSSAASGDARAARGVRAGVWFGAVLGLLIAAALVVVSRSKFPTVGQAGAGVAAVLAVTALASVVYTQVRRKERMAGALWVMGGGMMVFMIVLLLGIAPLLGPHLSTRSIVSSIPQKRGVVVAEYDSKVPSLLFYLGRTPLRMANVSEARQLLHNAGPVLLICKRKAAPEVITPGAEVISTDGKRALIANQPAMRLKELKHVK